MGKIVYPDKFKPNDSVECLRSIYFMYGGEHIKGNVYTVTKETVSYYNVNHKDYKLIEK